MPHAVVGRISDYLTQRQPDAIGLSELLERIESATFPAMGTHAPPAHAGALNEALTEIRGFEDPLLASIGTAIQEAGTSLEWRVDDGSYYPPGSGVSDTYRLGNMHTELSEGDDFAMGLFLLVPDVDYLDHRHRAPEFYLNLTNGSRWRFDFGCWRELSAGSVLWNESGAVHATRTGDTPWLSMWAWLRNVDQQCEVVLPY